jgi:Zn finger protein HypA/HybF involved in hydrogenase expression
MKVLTTIAIVVLSVAIAFAGTATHKYVGVKKCQTCHKLAKYGDQTGIWQKSAHAKAYETLAGEEALAVGKKLGIENPQKSDKCLTCHVTAFMVPDSLKEATLTMEEGISCEACHGPGSDYKSMSIMKDRAKAIAAGLLIPDEKTCLTCHNDKSPTYKPFDYAKRVKEIAHPIPKKESAK